MLREIAFVIFKIVTHSVYSEVLSGIAALWLCWRLWTFTVLPFFQPNVPKQLPYLIPFLGHARSFIASSEELINRGKEYFNNNGEPFALTVGGKTLYILTEPEHVAEVYKNNTTLSWDAMLNDLLIGFGISPSIIGTLWKKQPIEIVQASRSDVDPAKVPLMSIIHSTLDLYKRQLLPGPKLDIINASLTRWIDRYLEWNDVKARYPILCPTGDRINNLSLLKLCSDVLVGAVAKTFFGAKVYDVEPGLTEALQDFNTDVWMLVFQYPHGKNSRLAKARRKILNAFNQTSKFPASERDDQAWLIKASMSELEANGIESEDAAAIALMIYWAANINPYKLAFWMLSHILHTPSLHQRLLLETSPAFTHPTTINTTYLLNECPLLDSLYKETLRYASNALSARKLIAPTTIGSKLLSAPHTILLAFRQLQMDPRAFAHPAHFDPERFMRDKHLSNSMNFKPFGGGVNYCPGRFLARQEMFVFVASVINRFEVSLSTGTGAPQRFPRLDLCTPSLGVNAPMMGDDVFIDLKRREGI